MNGLDDDEKSGEKKVFDFKVFLHKDFIKEGAAAESYLHKVSTINLKALIILDLPLIQVF